MNIFSCKLLNGFEIYIIYICYNIYAIKSSCRDTSIRVTVLGIKCSQILKVSVTKTNLNSLHKKR